MALSKCVVVFDQILVTFEPKCFTNLNFYYRHIGQHSHLDMSFRNLGLTTLLFNNHNDLITQETLEMLDLFGMKINFQTRAFIIYIYIS